MSENVLCVKAEALRLIFAEWRERREVGPMAGSLRHLIRLVSLPPEMFVCGVRPACETDESIKQLCTYVSVFCDDDILTYRRGSKGDEGRLHAKRSVGIGGHVNSYRLLGTIGWELRVLFSVEARREISEEIGYVKDIGLFPTGLIYDPSDPVGRVHLGITFALYLSSKDGIGANCPSIEGVRWIPLDILRGNSFVQNEYESWSRHLLQSSLF